MTTEPLNLTAEEVPFWKDVFVEAIRDFWNRDDDDLGPDPVHYGNRIAHAAITELRRNRAVAVGEPVLTTERARWVMEEYPHFTMGQDGLLECLRDGGWEYVRIRDTGIAICDAEARKRDDDDQWRFVTSESQLRQFAKGADHDYLTPENMLTAKPRNE